MFETLLSAAVDDDEVALVVVVAVMLVWFVEDCCSSFVGSVGDRFALVSLFPSLMLLGELRVKKIYTHYLNNHDHGVLLEVPKVIYYIKREEGNKISICIYGLHKIKDGVKIFGKGKRTKHYTVFENLVLGQSSNALLQGTIVDIKNQTLMVQKCNSR